MLRFEGARDFPRHTPDQVWARLSDARFLVQCIPDVHEVRESAPEQAVCALRPGFAFVRGTLEVTLRVAEAAAPASVRLLLSSKGIGTSSEVEATMGLSAQEAGSRVQWAAEVKSLGGLLKAVPPAPPGPVPRARHLAATRLGAGPGPGGGSGRHRRPAGRRPESFPCHPDVLRDELRRVGARSWEKAQRAGVRALDERGLVRGQVYATDGSGLGPGLRPVCLVCASGERPLIVAGGCARATPPRTARRRPSPRG